MGNRIEALRKKTNLSRRKLGLKTNIPEASLRRYEAGETEPKLETWEKLANFFGVSTGYLMGLSDSPKRAFIDPVEIALDNRKLFEQMVDTTSQWDGSDYSELVPSAVKEKIGKNLNWFATSYTALVSHYDTPGKKTEIEPGVARLLDLEYDIIKKLYSFHDKMNNELRSGAKLDSSLEYVLEFIAGFLEREYRRK
ncbi:helix-turn-helix domain-containing protein [Ligilactobacillus agilis]|uniref:helix-turn-helix domain-containing protein n=1 Tax=Ligilactobacillus agilis TaxID=1601 RepID=UPI0015DEE669|nr:helix-turn-helix transcriptional regulator [Ligilactobacillus agilis]